jgi:hypothetical protein
MSVQSIGDDSGVADVHGHSNLFYLHSIHPEFLGGEADGHDADGLNSLKIFVLNVPALSKVTPLPTLPHPSLLSPNPVTFQA